MRIIFSITIFILCSVYCFSQNKILDSLKHELAIAKHDTDRILIMCDLTISLTGSDPDSALSYGEKALALAKRIHFPKGEVQAISHMSRVMSNTGNLPKSLSMALEALQIAEKNKLEIEKKWPFADISAVYRSLKDFSKAIEFRKNSLRISEDSNDSVGIRVSYSVIGQIYSEAGQLDSALFFLNKFISANKGNAGPTILKTLGDIEAQKGNNVSAMDYYQKAIKSIPKSSNNLNTSLLFISIANLYKKRNQRDSSLYWAEKALTESETIYFKKNIIEASTLLSELYEPISEKESYRYYKLATTTKESLFGAGNIQALQMMIAQEEERQKEVERVNTAFQNQLKQYALISGLTVFFLIALILYRNNKKQKGVNTILFHQKEEINQKSQELENTLINLKATQSQLIQSEKMASLGELTAGIAHEIQNPLNFVNNFSEVSVDLAKELKEEVEKLEIPKKDKEFVSEIIGDLSQNQEKINHHGKRASDIVKSMLEHSRKSAGEKESTDINSLCDEYLRLAYHGLKAKDNDFHAIMETHFDPNLPQIKLIAQDIGRVLLNLINNAFYACAERTRIELNPGSLGTVSEKSKVENQKSGSDYQPTVRISTKSLGDKIEISLTDNGNGIPDSIKEKIFQPFFTTKPTGQGTGLGLSLAYDIVKAHGGELKLVTKEGEGSEFSIQLPRTI